MNYENLPPNYEGENMLIGANDLNNRIKSYMDMLDEEGSFPDSKGILDEYILDIEDYIPDIERYNFAPRDDRLTKEGILVDLGINLERVKDFLTRNYPPASGGKRKLRKGTKGKKGKKTKKSRKNKTSKRRARR